MLTPWTLGMSFFKVQCFSLALRTTCAVWSFCISLSLCLFCLWHHWASEELILGELHKHKWVPAGGPNFGNMMLTWPAVLLQRKVSDSGPEEADPEAVSA